MTDLRITAADDPASCRAVEDVERDVWGLPERAIVPAEQIRAVIHNGGMLLLAHDGDTLAGFCYAFVGIEDGRPIWCSHMLAVLPPWRSRGLGRALKLAQRDLARERGISKITWTFDPLQARNAYLNLRRLGAYARRYYVNHYGAMEDDINRGMPTDRLLAEWPVAGRAPATAPDAAAWILPVTGDGTHPRPATPAATMPADGGLIAVPADITRLRDGAGDALKAWRLALRAAMQGAFAAGLAAVDLRRDVAPGVSAYVLGHLR